ncbi:MAG: hypothetical protein PGN23_03950 [Sphingomonas adhaesiva]|uniref:hypothetical protein n=1 Tax=Sphingomonas adhaesiva TaxID=28212 RepID=UPI002FFBCBB4
MTPTPPELRRRRLALALMTFGVLIVSRLHDEPMIGTLSFSFDAGRLPQVEASPTPLVATVAGLLVEGAQRLIR